MKGNSFSLFFIQGIFYNSGGGRRENEDYTSISYVKVHYISYDPVQYLLKSHELMGELTLFPYEVEF